ncbi:tRNA pseudouridine(55) synthase TruB [Clostridium fallax]|uniref:tRNA pseudouridine synthase B n=1 Tax=Clostridium fallax TaxID=1533 RepID=A0A1M4V3J2_9CLOT|nr:tRNA pseudouridine(55) synthase TruB [Clostridium fallax]SHE63472.1 tRNA pseudouridine synthase B [Clostridium fallax]SQB06569.1 tRNA pseudouridine synthase B [Clostridium fallax]
MNGVINVFKNTGMTSFDVVSKIRKLSKIKKVGHTGTLDPEASGVLPVCLGKATKIIDYIMSNEKTYEVTLKLGVVTDTYDLEGKVIREGDSSTLKEEEILSVINTFKGEIDQIPPMYSALKVNGKKLYELARQGIEVEREPRKITIYDIYDVDISNPFIVMKVRCSKGTYIRSLCYDIGEKLECGAVMTKLCRTENGPFKESNSINIEDLTEETIKENIITIEEALKAFPKVIVDSKFTKLLINGVKVGDSRLLKEKIPNNTIYRVYDDKLNFIGLGKKDELGFKIVTLLYE